MVCVGASSLLGIGDVAQGERGESFTSAWSDPIAGGTLAAATRAKATGSPESSVPLAIHRLC